MVIWPFVIYGSWFKAIMVYGSRLRVQGSGLKVHGYDTRREVDSEVSGGDWFH